MKTTQLHAFFQKRYIVSRDPDGTLRNASWDERDRMIKTFFPSPKQKYGIPKMFLDDHLMVSFNVVILLSISFI